MTLVATALKELGVLLTNSNNIGQFVGVSNHPVRCRDEFTQRYCFKGLSHFNLQAESSIYGNEGPLNMVLVQSCHVYLF